MSEKTEEGFLWAIRSNATSVKFPPSPFKRALHGVYAESYGLVIPHTKTLVDMTEREVFYDRDDFEAVLKQAKASKRTDTSLYIRLPELSRLPSGYFLLWTRGRGEWVAVECSETKHDMIADFHYSGPYSLSEKFSPKIFEAFDLNDFFQASASAAEFSAIDLSPEKLNILAAEPVKLYSIQLERFIQYAREAPDYSFDGFHETGLGDLEISLDYYSDIGIHAERMFSKIQHNPAMYVRQENFLEFIDTVKRLISFELPWQIHLKNEIAEQESRIPDNGHYTDHVTGQHVLSFDSLKAPLEKLLSGLEVSYGKKTG